MATRKTKRAPSRASGNDRAQDYKTRDREEGRIFDRAPKPAIVAPGDKNTDGFVAEAEGLLHRSQGRNALAGLDTFYDQSLIIEVDRIIKIGKEASAYLCHAGEELGGGLVVAKVYRDRQYRFKNDAIYMEGRERVLGGRTQRAVAKNTAFGQTVGTHLWVNAEWEKLQLLHKAGLPVPKPLALSGGAILMEYFGDEDEAAPQLNRIRFTPAEARTVFDGLMRNVQTMLANHVVHGDLSPHNILYWQGRATIIDLPQAVDPRFNSQARELFLRDIDNVCRYFNLAGLELDAWQIGDAMWKRYEVGEL